MRRRLVRLLPGLLVSLSFTVWFVLNAHWTEVGAALRGVHLGWVALSATVLFTEFLIRTLRWKLLLRPLAPDARFGRLFVATVIGMSMNVVLPFRAGDLARPWLGSRETGGSLLPLVTVAVIERVFDLCGLLGVFLLTFLLLPGTSDAALLERLEAGGAVFGACGVLGLGTLVWLAANEQRARGVYEWGLRFVPQGPAAKIRTLLVGLSVGLGAVRSPAALAGALGLSLLHWFNGALSIWLLFHAFDLDLPLAAACFTSVLLALSVMLPQAPGFVGVFHVAVATALRVWQMDPGPAEAYAIAFWGVSFLPITTLGAILTVREGLDPRVLLRGETTAPQG